MSSFIGCLHLRQKNGENKSLWSAIFKSTSFSMKFSNRMPLLVERADDELFESILHNPHHVLNNLMPDET